MRHLPWRPRMGAATSVFLVTGLFGIIAGTQVPRLMGPAQSSSQVKDYQAPLEQVHRLSEVRPMLMAIHESLAAGKMSMDEAVKSVESLIAGTSLEVSPDLFDGTNQREKIANMTIYWTLEAIAMEDRGRVGARLNSEFRTLFGRDCGVPAIAGVIFPTNGR